VKAFVTVPRRSETIEAFKRQGGSIAAVFPIHYPRSLLRAFGFLPVEVWGPPGVDTSSGATHLQAYVCSIVHSALSFLLSGGLDVADLLVVPHACDSLQGLGSILTDLIPCRQPVIPIYLPRGRRESDLDFLSIKVEEQQPGKRFQINLSVDEDVPIGVIKGKVTIHTNDPLEPQVEIPVSGTVRVAPPT